MSNGKEPFQVHGSGAITQAFLRIQEQAAREGRGEKVLAAMRVLSQKLKQEPDELGEPLYRLPFLRMQIRTAVVRPLVIHFGVCENMPLVFMKSIKLLALKS